MRRERVLTLLACCQVAALVPITSGAAIVVSDDFELASHPTGDRRDAAGLGIRFYTRESSSAVNAAIVSDAITGSQALSVTDLNSPASSSKPIIGLLPMTLQLANTGDFATLTFSFHYVNNASVAANPANFRFGLLHSNGTPVTADSQPATSDNDRGYYVQVGSGGTAPTSVNLFYNERGTTLPIIGGADRDPVTGSSGGLSINDNNLHTASFTLTRISSTAVSLSFAIDGGTPITGTDSTANIRTTFDEIVFSNGFTATGLNYVLDQVVVSSSIPEPGAALGALAGTLLLGYKRSRSSLPCGDSSAGYSRSKL